MELFVATFLKMFFIMTPFFVLSVFLTVTTDATLLEKRALAIKVTTSVIVISIVLLYFGKYIFAVFGITLDAFRIGAGALLFLSAVELIKGNKDTQKIEQKDISELAVVPLSIPITIGPGTIGVLLVMGAGFKNAAEHFVGSIALVCAVVVIGLMLYFSHIIKKVVGRQGLLVVSKITGLFLAALSAQIIFTGIKNFLNI
ncbi:MarC family protein [Campylobacterota bacterium DY0563]|uniref:MarC family protein n=1 Tax=Halarcobacter sp. TaxID=2321133 RepID=UPI0029F53C4D|nr:MarC family protein [Halarcobacter sp.]